LERDCWGSVIKKKVIADGKPGKITEYHPFTRIPELLPLENEPADCFPIIPYNHVCYKPDPSNNKVKCIPSKQWRKDMIRLTNTFIQEVDKFLQEH